MEFFGWASFLFWSLAIGSWIALLQGFWKKSWRSVFISSILAILPSLYFLIAVNNSYQYLALTPVILLILSYVLKLRKQKNL
jgi:hypothetical protein